MSMLKNAYIEEVRNRTEYLITLAVESICNNYHLPKFSVDMTIEETLIETTKNVADCLILSAYYPEIVYNYVQFSGEEGSTHINAPLNKLLSVLVYIIRIGIIEIISNKIIKRGIPYECTLEFIRLVKEMAIEEI